MIESFHVSFKTGMRLLTASGVLHDSTMRSRGRWIGWALASALGLAGIAWAVEKQLDAEEKRFEDLALRLARERGGVEGRLFAFPELPFSLQGRGGVGRDEATWVFASLVADPSPEAVRKRAVLALLLDRPERAVEELEREAKRDPVDCCWQNDLAVARIARFVRQGDPEDLFLAWDLIETAASRRPADPVVLFNRALVRDLLGLRRPAIGAWRAFLEQEGAGTLWGRVGWERLDAALAPPQARRPDGGPPTAEKVYLLAERDYQERRYDAASRRLSHLLASLDGAPPSLLAGQAYLFFGLIQMVEGSAADSLPSYRRAEEIFSQIGYQSGMSKVASSLSERHLALGDLPSAGRKGLDAVRLAQGVHNHYVLYNALEALAQAAAAGGHLRLAVFLESEAVRLALAKLPPSWGAGALRNRSDFLRREGRAGEALSDLERAEAVARKIPDPLERATVAADLAFTTGEVLRSQEPERAVIELTRAIEDHLASGYRHGIVHLLAARALAHEALDRQSKAAADFAAAAVEADRQAGEGTGDAKPTSTSARFVELFRERVRFELEGGRPEVGLEIASRLKAHQLQDRLLAGSRSGLSLAALQSRLPEDAALVDFTILSRQVIAFVVRPRGFGFARLRVGNRHARLATRLGQALSQGQEDDARRLGRLAYSALIAPLEPELGGVRRVFVVADAPLDSLPWAALWDGRRFLVERWAVVTVPSAALFSSSADRGFPPETPPRGLLVADPEISPEALSRLPRLPEAEKEVNAIALLWPGSHVLVGRAATKRAFLNRMKAADLLHYAGHVVVRHDEMAAPRLLLAGGGTASTKADLLGLDLAGRRFPRTRLAILAGCNSGLPSSGSGEAGNLGYYFLGAGIPAVLTTRLSLDDHPKASALLLDFHAELRRGSAPSVALQKAQIRHSKRLPLAVWSAFALAEAGGG